MGTSHFRAGELLLIPRSLVQFSNVQTSPLECAILIHTTFGVWGKLLDRKWRGFAAAAFVSLACSLMAACAGEGPSDQADGSTRASPPMSNSSGSPEAHAADGVVAYAASELSGALANDERFASVEVLGGDRIVVHWDGPVDSKLQNLLDRFPGLNISVQTTFCSPGKLRDFGRELMASDPAVTIVSVSPDGSKLRITVDESLKSTLDVASLERKYSEAVGCPVEVEFGGVVPIAG